MAPHARAVAEPLGEFDHGARAMTGVLEAVLGLRAFPAAPDQSLSLVGRQAMGRPASEAGAVLLGEACGDLGARAAGRL
jgi:hypothetical protein